MTSEFSPKAEEASRNIFQRINAVQREIGYIQKDKSVSTGGGSYKAVTHDAVTAQIRKHLIDHGIAISTTLEQHTFHPREEGSKQRLMEGVFIVSFINIDSPDDNHHVRVVSQALDSGDKAPGKLISYATKYAMLKTFLLETGDDEESRYQETYDFAGELTRAENAPREEAREIIKQAQAEALRLKDAAAAKAISLVSKALTEKFKNADKHSHDAAGQA